MMNGIPSHSVTPNRNMFAFPSSFYLLLESL
jgi:hypothetical protein